MCRGQLTGGTGVLYKTPSWRGLCWRAAPWRGTRGRDAGSAGRPEAVEAALVGSYCGGAETCLWRWEGPARPGPGAQHPAAGGGWPSRSADE